MQIQYNTKHMIFHTRVSTIVSSLFLFSGLLLLPSHSAKATSSFGAKVDIRLYATRVATTPASAAPAHLRVFTTDGKEAAPAGGLYAFTQAHKGGARLAVCDVDGDGKGEIVAGAGPGGGPQVRVFKGDGTALPIQFFAFKKEFRGGVDVGCADVDGDGKGEIVVSQFSKGQAWVKVYRYETARRVIGEWNAFGASEVGATVAGCDIDGDGKDEICVGAGTGGGPHVRVFEADGTATSVQFFAFAPSSRTGVDVAAGDTDGDGKDEILISQLQNGQAWMKIYRANAKRTVLSEWNAFGTPEVGANVEFADVNGDGTLDVLAAANVGGGPQIRMFSTDGKYLGKQFFAYDQAFRGGVSAIGGRLSATNEKVSTALEAAKDLKVAFLGDASAGPNARAVLEMVKEQGADAVVHAGDLGYGDGPEVWNAMIDDVLGTDFPYFIAAGNHDFEVPGQWDTYADLVTKRLEHVPGALCKGTIGVDSTCVFRGLLMAFSGVGTAPGSDIDADAETLSANLASRPARWNICVWHKDQRLMQVGGKSDEVGWGVYEACREKGAIIATAHEHSYERTHLLSDFSSQTIASTSSLLNLMPGKTFAFVSGLGGHDVRVEDPTLAANPWWASVYTADEDADFGALFCTFHVNGKADQATCTFRDIQGREPDTFTLKKTL